jgi:hypothetical protein
VELNKIFTVIDQKHEIAKKRKEEHSALVNENIWLKREALERDESEKVQKMKIENNKMKELFRNENFSR